jgi:hypothetical protein
MPPGPQDEKALDHSRELALVTRSAPKRTNSGLLRDLALGWAALGFPEIGGGK